MRYAVLVTCLGATSGISSIAMSPTFVRSFQVTFTPLKSTSGGGFGSLTFQPGFVLSIFCESR